MAGVNSTSDMIEFQILDTLKVYSVSFYVVLIN
jgi:hypothetical protein